MKSVKKCGKTFFKIERLLTFRFVDAIFSKLKFY